MNEITLILDRRNRYLWIAIEGNRISVGWDVDGVEKTEGGIFHNNFYRVLRNHKQVGIIWDVKEVQEEW